MSDLRLQRFETIFPSNDSKTPRSRKDDLVISRQAVQKVSQKINASFENLRLIRIPSLPIPIEKCVPIMPTREQVLEYESQFLNSAPEELQNLTVAEILQPYSHSKEPTKTGKVQFLLEFFSRVRDMSVNLDVAIVCNSHRSENSLVRELNGHNFNYRPTSHLLPMKRVYGVIVKFRKKAKADKPVSRTDVDIVMVYDSAIEYSQKKIHMFPGATYEEPLVIHLTTMDTADIRLYNSAYHKQLTWSSRLSTIPYVDQQQLFYQHNRKQAKASEVLSWNEFVATEVAKWASLKLDKNYTFQCPKKKNPLLQIYLSFNFCHPRVQVKEKKTASAHPIAIASPRQPNSTTAKASDRNKHESSPKVKQEGSTNSIPSSNANPSSAGSRSFTGKGKGKAQISSSTPNSVVKDLKDVEVENSASPATPATPATPNASQSHSVPSTSSIHPDRLTLLESTDTLSSAPLKRARDLDMNDDSYGMSGKRANTKITDETNKTSDEAKANSQDQFTSTDVEDFQSTVGLSDEADDYSSFLQEALQQFQQEMLNVPVKF